jgi:hypothetical protein
MAPKHKYNTKDEVPADRPSLTDLNCRPLGWIGWKEIKYAFTRPAAIPDGEQHEHVHGWNV